eukprot:m.406903 g.406903  ORF g.406903 m.406903 type:complete len:152 (+) comp21218_c1_seq3:252-707(+)
MLCDVGGGRSTTLHGPGPCAEETNNGHGSTFANKYFASNTCVFVGDGNAPAYQFQSCTPDTATLNATVWHTHGNTYLIRDDATVYVPCDHAKVSLSTWQQSLQQDLGATTANLPSPEQVRTLGGYSIGGAFKIFVCSFGCLRCTPRVSNGA